MTPTPLVLYLASFETADAAAEDFAGVRRLKRDGVIGTAVAGIIVRQAPGWIWYDAATPPTQAAPATDRTNPRANELLDVLVAQTLPERGCDAAEARAAPPVWLENEAEQEFREQLTTAGAAVVVLAEERVAPALRVALARAHSFVQRRLTNAELHQAAAQQTPNATPL